MVRVSTVAIERQPVGSEESFSLALADWPGARGSVRAEGTLSRLEGGVAVRMRADWQAEGRCDRCLGEVAVPVSGEATASTVSADPGETQLQVEDQEIDLTPLLEEIEVLSWPSKVLCRESCLGLCPHCGQNLNQGQCRCRPEAAPGPFAGLRDLLGKDD